MNTDELLYVCINQKCRNYYLRKNAKVLSISFVDYKFEITPRCFKCRHKMNSEVEQIIEFLKLELKIPAENKRV